jgi:AAA15 family ATPase/GTPase
MIVSFTLENWMSFREKTTFSMIASKERQHGDRLPKLGKYNTRLLPIATIYGGNASGKTNFFKALNFARALVVHGTKPDRSIPVEPFLLDSKSGEKPSRFEFVLLIDETMYEYSFSLTRKSVLKEKLVKIHARSEKILYSRQNGKLNLHPSIHEAKKNFLGFAFQGTRDNQLFFFFFIWQRVDDFRPIYNWFSKTLELIAPDSRFDKFESFLDEGHPHYSIMSKMLPMLATGIAHLGYEQISFENIPLPESLKKNIYESLDKNSIVRLSSEIIVKRRKNGKIIAKKLMAYHKTENGSMTTFEIRHESDGSQRVIALLPAFLNLTSKESNKVYVIDEVDRSLHTTLSRWLVEAYLADCAAETRGQLLLTTHDVLLMDQKIMRRDEMWVTERDAIGSSSLTSFSEYMEIRYDKDIRKSYLQGRLGGIPQILLSAPSFASEKGEGS